MDKGGAAGFFGWKVVWAAFTVAVFGWGLAFYGLPVYMHTLQVDRGFSVGLVSWAATAHFLVGSLAVANMPAIYASVGLVRTTKAGALLLCLGAFGWAIAAEPWQLFAATLLSGMGWAATGAVAINAFVAPWFYRRRAAALSLAYNGASVGGIVFPPLLVALIAALGFPVATAVLAVTALVVIWLLAARVFSLTPADLGTEPDAGLAGSAAASATPIRFTPLPGRALWANPSFITYTAAFTVALFAQAGLLAHLFSLLVPVLGETGAGYASALSALCAIAGRTLLGLLLGPSVSRRKAAALTLLLQATGCGAFALASGSSIPLSLLGVVLFGLGVGVAISIGPLIAQAEFSGADTVRAIALATAVSQATYAFAPAAFGLLREWRPHDPVAFFAAVAVLQVTAAAIYVVKPRLAEA